jgi:membrane dipeptidase
MMGVEGGHMIDLSLAVLRAYFHLGVRYMTLTHGCNVKWADSATDVVVNDGLSQFGVAVVAEMNRLGMLVDLAHVSANVMKDAIDNSVAPVIFSHSSAFAICNHPRNVPDDVLRMLSKKGGVVMVNFYSGYVKCGGDDSLGNAKLSDVADHIEHIAKVAGWEHVGIGGDYDGVDRLPDGLEDVSKYPDLVAELARRGATEDQLAGLVGMNLIRVWQQAEKVAEELKSERPHEDLYEINKVCPVQSSLKFLNQDQHLKQN